MGISILIPVYNFDTGALVQTLANQLQKTGRHGEIIILDDASVSPIVLPEVSDELASFIRLYHNQKNEGRMLARQQLGRLASHEYLLFLDGDSEIAQDNYLQQYFEQADAGENLVSGGRLYQRDRPADCDLALHWKYGSLRESRNYPGKGKGPAFMSNNFLVKKQLFAQLISPFALQDYGHEDTWWGIQFIGLGVGCKYINNPVIHAALEKAAVFLIKSEKALTNLLVLEKNVNPSLLKKEVKIFRWYYRMKTMGLTSIFLFFEKPFHQFFRRNLLSCNPILFYFDLYRLAQLHRISKTGISTQAT